MGEINGGGSGLNSNVPKDLRDKEIFASGISKSVQVTPEDQSRSTLHTGDQHEGSLAQRETVEGAQRLSLEENAAFAHQAQDEVKPSKVDAPTETPAPIVPVPSLSGSQQPSNTVYRRESFEPKSFEVETKISANASMTAQSAPAERGKPVEMVDQINSDETLSVNAPSDPAPAGVPIRNIKVVENADGQAVATLSAHDRDDEEHHSFSVSDDRFEVVDGELKLKDGIALNHEAEARIDVQVTITDAAGSSHTEVFAIEVTDANDAVTGVILSHAAVAENAGGAVVGVLSVQDEDAGDRHSFSVSDDRFEVVDSELKLKDGIELDFEVDSQVVVQVTATDAAGFSYSEEFAINVTDQNEAPTRLTLSTNTGNLVQNGSFEEFDLDHGRWGTFKNDTSGAWDSTAGMEIWDNLGGTKASDGQQHLELDAGRGVDSFYQTVQTSKGQVYDLGLDLRERLANGTDTVEVYWNNELIAELNPESTDWTTFDMQVIGTGEDRLELREQADENDTYGALVDNITLTATPNTLAENTSGAIVGELSFHDPDSHDSHSYSVSDDRFEVVNGVLRLKENAALDYEDAKTVEVTVKVTDADGLSTSETFVVNVADTPDLTVSTGFHAQYFDVNKRLSSLEDIDWAAEPTHQEVISEIDYQNSGDSFWEDDSRDTFGVQISGAVQVEEGGIYRFDLGGDDGAQLMVNGQLVVENDGLHAYQTKSGEVHLDPGIHHIEVRYFENYGHAGLKLEWEGPGMDGPELVSAPDVASVLTVSGVPTALSVAHPDADQNEAVTLTVKGLPAGSVVAAGDQTLVVGDDGSVDLTGIAAETLTFTTPHDFVGEVEALLTVSGDGLTDISQPVSFAVEAAQIAEPSVAVRTGFHAEYFDSNQRIGKLDGVNWDADPTHQEIKSEIDYDNGHGSFWEGGSKDTFAARFQGKVTIDEGGTYTFFTSADDGVALYVDGQEVVKDDGNHSYRSDSGQIVLEPGTHDIELRYFENYGRAGLKLEWEGPGIEGRQVVQPDQEAAVDVNGTLNIAVEIDLVSENTSVRVEGLPPATILSSGEDALVTDGGPADLSGWNLDALEISPPPEFAGVISGEVAIESIAFNGATVTSTANFTIAVGDAHSDPVVGVLSESVTLTDTDAAVGEPVFDVAWDVAADQIDAVEREATDGSNPDVMAEPVTVQQVSDVTQINTETYERVEW